jgi:hypothetical protein
MGCVSKKREIEKQPRKKDKKTQKASTDNKGKMNKKRKR